MTYRTTFTTKKKKIGVSDFQQFSFQTAGLKFDILFQHNEWNHIKALDDKKKGTTISIM